MIYINKLKDILTVNVQKELKKEGIIVSKAYIEKYLECSEKNDFTPLHSTTLYTKYGWKYCRMLEVINWEEKKFKQ